MANNENTTNMDHGKKAKQLPVAERRARIAEQAREFLARGGEIVVSPPSIFIMIGMAGTANQNTRAEW